MSVFPSSRRIAAGRYEMTAGDETLVIFRRKRRAGWSIQRGVRYLNGDDEPFPTKREACSFAWDWLGEHA